MPGQHEVSNILMTAQLKENSYFWHNRTQETEITEAQEAELMKYRNSRLLLQQARK